MTVYYPLPLDAWGFSLDEIRQILKQHPVLKARLSKERYSYDLLQGFQIKDIGEYQIIAPNSKKLHLAIRIILDKKRKRDNPQQFKSIFERK
jgi:hypothetical protein